MRSNGPNPDNFGDDFVELYNPGSAPVTLDAIKKAIEHVNEFVTNTAAAVEEQSAVTSDMSSNMQKAAAELAA